MAVTEIPEVDDLEIVIGDDYEGATLNLSESPGTGTWAAVLEGKSGRLVDLDVLELSPTELVISMTQAATLSLKAGPHTWSLLFKQTAPPVDRTIAYGGAVVKSFPTRNK